VENINRIGQEKEDYQEFKTKSRKYIQIATKKRKR
jgi:hypothetical protein